MATTYTSTKTYTRLLFLQRQIREVLRSTTRISDTMLDKILIAVERKWITRIDIYALDNNNLCRARLQMDIDWNEYQQQIAIGRISVAIDTRWENDLLPQTDSAIWAFNQYIDRYGLWTEWRISYTDQVYNDQLKLAEVRSFLGTSPAKPVQWAGEPINEYVKNNDLPEFGIGLYFIE